MEMLLYILLSPFVLMFALQYGKSMTRPNGVGAENENGNNEKTTQQILQPVVWSFVHSLLSGLIAPSMA